MKKIVLFFTAALLVYSYNATAQVRQLKKVMELQMPKKVGDDLCGTRGASVVWNPLTKKYYAGFAGNSGFPMGVFNMAGKRLSEDDQTTLIDIRGLWYNPKSKAICGNAYGSIGWFKYTLDAKGMPESLDTLLSGYYQPSENSVGCYHQLRDEVLFLNGPNVSLYTSSDGGSDESRSVHWGRKKSQGPEAEMVSDLPPMYNNNVVLYTGIKGSELGFLNVKKKQIELYEFEKGFMTTALKLPSTAKTEESFNLAFANGIYWLFDLKNRKWVGYK